MTVDNEIQPYIGPESDDLDAFFDWPVIGVAKPSDAEIDRVLEAFPGWKELNRPAPDLLYHYCRHDALIGICTQKTLWASHVRYMNDSQEYVHGFKLAVDSVDRIAQEHRPAKAASEYLDKLRSALNSVPYFPLCVFSLTERRDDLSQWRAYTAYGNGYSVGFDGKQLQKLTRASGWGLIPCIYKADHKQDLVDSFIRTFEHVVSNNVRHIRPEQVDVEVGRQIIFFFLIFCNLLGSCLKDESFADESEWRLVCSPLSRGWRHANGCFRPGQHSLIPYVTLGLPADHLAEGLIHEIVVGATAEPELSRRAVSYLVQANNVKAEVAFSASPFVPR